MLRNLFYFLLLSLICSTGFAQKNEIGVFMGGAFYRGEISDFSFKTPGGVVGLLFRQNWNAALSTQYTFSYGSLRASDEYNPSSIGSIRKYEFQTNITEISIQAAYNFYDFGHFDETVTWTPYLFGGVAIFSMNPQSNTNNTNNRPYNNLQFAIPFGVGAKFLINENWNVSLQLGARKTFTDYIDDLYVSSTRNNPKLYEENSSNKDMYFFGTVGLSYVIQARPCPSIYKRRTIF